ncbi:hypothetical protein [Aquirufa regiilacus]|uniref:O-antigen ligase domain-containing protein n=1 Tax=Aquirufa regiilacus TaxID=3024868 RepID=A0ABU3TSV3_9BACT|nr:hypothetical protein [Aquirufa sp. LEOWEIH-7C]MDU0808905.1 hypothetical protein [Aquirufa sp. LEOWEIH-7C]
MQFVLVVFFSIFFYDSLNNKLFNNRVKVYFLLVIILIMLDFFGGESKGAKAICFLGLPFIFFDYKRPSIFKGYIILFIIGLFISMLSCYYFRNQTLMESFWQYNYLYALTFYFLIKAFNLPAVAMERVLVILVVLFCVAYFYQYSVYPSMVFIYNDQEYEANDVRVRLVGQGLASLGYFYSLNKILINKKNRLFFLLLLLATLLSILLMGFRTMLLGIVLMTSIIVIKIIGFNRRLLIYSILISIFSLFVLNLEVVSNKLNSMSERQKTDNLSNNDYVRLLQLNYYMTEHFKSNSEYLLGSGLPQRGDKENNIKASSYGKYMDSLLSQGLTWVDWGLLSMSWVIGIIPVLTSIFYSIKAYRIKTKKEHLYLGVWFMYILIISFTTIEILRAGNLALQAFCFVLIETTVRNNNVDFLKKKELISE